MWPRQYMAPFWYAPINRDKQRKEIKIQKRKLRIQTKALTLFEKCSVSIIIEGELSEEEESDLTNVFSKLICAEYDYYPIPKVIHNKLRRYIHKHPHIEDVPLKDYLRAKWEESLVGASPAGIFSRYLDGLTGLGLCSL